MIKLNELLNHQEIMHYISQIKKDCKEQINIIKGDKAANGTGLLIRGMNSFNLSEIGSKEVRKDRRPKDTEQHIDYIVEEFRAEFYPDVPSRRKSVFCFVDKSLAVQQYGYPYFIFIPDGAKYFQSIKTSDLTQSIIPMAIHRVFKEIAGEDTESMLSGLERKTKLDNIKVEAYNAIVNRTNEHPLYHRAKIFLNEYFKNSINSLKEISIRDSENEIVIDCDYYYYISETDSYLIRELRK